MSKRRRIAGSLLALAMVLSCMMFGMTSVAFADTYDYTVTVSGGAQGEVDGESTVTYSAGEDGSYGSWDASDYSVNVTNDKYYFKGWRIGGQENLITGFDVTKDIDIVASYGVAGDDIVAYTVTFTSEDGTELHSPQTYYGKIGEKPVVSYLYVEGYLPQAYNLTKTLSADESENVFPFVYSEMPAGEGGENGEGGEGGENGEGGEGGEGAEGEGAEGGGAAGGGAAGGGAAGGAAGGAGAADGGAGTVDDGGAADDGAATIDDDANPQGEGEPEDTVDLDDDDTPLAPGEEPGDEENGGGLSKGMIAGIAVAIAALIGILVALMRKRNDGGEEA